MRAPCDQVPRRCQRLHRFELLAMDAPKHARAESPNAGAARRVIQKRQLAHSVADPDDAYRLQSKQASASTMALFRRRFKECGMCACEQSGTYHYVRSLSADELFRCQISRSRKAKGTTCALSQPSGVNQAWSTKWTKASALSLFAGSSQSCLRFSRGAQSHM